jgi:hypothetical protein
VLQQAQLGMDGAATAHNACGSKRHEFACHHYQEVTLNCCLVSGGFLHG